MRGLFFSWFLIVLFKQFSYAQYAKEQQFQLASPQIIYNGLLFEQENEVRFALYLEGVNIYYTLDESEPDEHALLFEDKIILKESAIIKVKAFHPQFSPSETVTLQMIKMRPILPVKNIWMDRAANEKYSGTGAKGLVDRKKGDTNFRTDEWMGFDGGNVETIIEFEQVENIHKVTVSVLSDPDSWIFIPQTIMVYSSTNGAEYKLLDTLTMPSPPKGIANSLEFLEMKFSSTSLKFLKIKVKHFEEIPTWHPGKGTPPWLFIDEILME